MQPPSSPHIRAASRLVAGILALAIGGCREATEPAADPNALVATFSGGEIRRRDIAAAVARRLAGTANPTPEARREAVRRVVERRVRIALMLAEARANGYDKRPETSLHAAAAVEKILAGLNIGSETASVHAPDALVEETLTRRLAAARRPELRSFSHIFLRAPQSDATRRRRAEERMGMILAELKKGQSFSTVARQNSDSIDARAGGRIEWTPRDDLRPAIADVLFSLREGELSPVERNADGLHLFRLEGIRPGVAMDPEGLRRSVRQELDGEARSVAERGLRRSALDAAGVEFASAREIEASFAKDRWVARWKGGEVRGAELRDLMASANMKPAGAKPFLQELVENRLLAARRPTGTLPADVRERLTAARNDALLGVYRTALMAKLDTNPTDDEVARYHEQNGQSALFLRDYRLDVLFLPQSGDDVAPAYAAGEKVVAQLRAGTPFEGLLARPGFAGARVCRDVHDIDIEALGKHSLRLRKTILNLDVSEVSPATYVDAPRDTSKPGDCLYAGPGVAFLRLRDIKTRSLASSRETIRAALSAQKERTGINGIQARLIGSSGLKILLPEG